MSHSQPPALTEDLVQKLQARISDLERRNARLNNILDVAKALGAERNLDVLLDTILREAREVVEADRLSLFIVDRERGELWTRIAHGMGSEKIRVPLGVGIAGTVAQTRQPLIIQDAYADPRFNRNVDHRTGYRTRNILTVPMLNRRAEAVGVLQALNKDAGHDFTEDDQELLMALGGQAAVAVENAMLYGDIERLLDGIIRASVYAIEARDPVTSGHSERVALLTVGLAEELALVRDGPLAGKALSGAELKELRYAALLHDFGKVGVREQVLTKANKLYPTEYELLRQRFSLARRSREMAHWRARWELQQSAGGTDLRAGMAELEAQLAHQVKELQAAWEFVTVCNRPTVLEEGGFERLCQIAQISFPDESGVLMPLLTEEEVRNLSIRRGSLNADERREIESHVTHSYRFLCRIPWTRELQRIPELAAAHHEQLNGKGYPRGLNQQDIPLQARIMTIADIYDALTAADRPYKKAVPHDRAVTILVDEARRGAVDGLLVDLFLQTEVHRRLENGRMEEMLSLGAAPGAPVPPPAPAGPGAPQ